MRLFSVFVVTAAICKIYTIAGVVRLDEGGMQIITNERTLSVQTYKIPIQEEPRLARFVNSPVVASLLVRGTDLQVEQVRSVELRVPDPLRANQSHPPQVTKCPL